MQMGRKMNALLTASQMNREVRLLCEEYFSKLKELIEVEVGLVHVEGDAQQDGPSSAKRILNPPRSQEKGQQNKRLKSTSEKKCNQAKARKKKKLSAHSITSEEGLPKATNLETRKTTEVVPENVTGVQESSKNFASFPNNIPYYVSKETLGKDPSGVRLPQNFTPFHMNMPFYKSRGSLTKDPSGGLLLRSTIAAIGRCPPFYFDRRTAGGLTPMMFQSFIGQTPTNGACNRSYNNDT
ncbi:hypothetical protein Cgig2_032129 [Carnegiea gigantea]|uniref:Uncharacterized protein n=1 Tax=Carnegiea gigantea TaxID=171969 RepID=A0A9Q1JT10_9CARY|nr:hypothetical protein Cgig2_032129 [Carnegiea gigantea]